VPAGVYTPEELRALREDEARHEHEPATREESLAWAEHILARIGEIPELEQLDHVPGDRCLVDTRREGGPCDDCEHERHRDHRRRDEPPRLYSRRFQIGPTVACRSCTIARITAGKRLEVEHAPTVLDRLHGDQRPLYLAMVAHWTRANARDLDDRLLRTFLDSDWHLTTAETRAFVKLARRIRDQPADERRPKDLDRWLREHADALDQQQLAQRLAHWHVEPDERVRLADLLADHHRDRRSAA
jgi:hypothetical protein